VPRRYELLIEGVDSVDGIGFAETVSESESEFIPRVVVQK
jgi:hypothetical protein